LHAIPQPQLGQDPADVGLDGALTDEERGADLGVRQALSQQLQDVSLARGQLLQLHVAIGLGGDDEALDQTPGDRGRQEGVARVGCPDRVDQVLGGNRLEQESRGAGAERVVDVLVHVERRQHQHPADRGGGGDPSSCFDPVHLGHADVDQGDVRLGPGDLGDRLPAVACFCDHLQVGLSRQDGAEATAHERLVVCDEDACHVPRSSSRGSRATTTNPPSG
jgi:hypothetical protein